MDLFLIVDSFIDRVLEDNNRDSYTLQDVEDHLKKMNINTSLTVKVKEAVDRLIQF